MISNANGLCRHYSLLNHKFVYIYVLGKLSSGCGMIRADANIVEKKIVSYGRQLFLIFIYEITYNDEHMNKCLFES